MPPDIRTMLSTDTPELLGALCAGRDPLWDYEIDGESKPERDARHAAAIRVCQRCPVLKACRAFGEKSPRTRYGVWGARLHIERPRGVARDGPERPAKAPHRPAAGEPTPDAATAA